MTRSILLLLLWVVPPSVYSFAIALPLMVSRRVTSKSSSLSLLSSSSSFPQQIQVFDNVFDQETCQDLLHELAVEHADRCDSSVVNRVVLDDNGDNNGDGDQITKTPLEHALNHLLTKLGDTSPIIEYWSRDEYMNIDAHCDIDERQLENEGTLRYPEYSHVLYLTVNVKGPTCVLNQQGGWMNTTNSNNDDDGDDEPTSLITVPAVEGRLLRFPGNLLHAVPKPPHRWLLTNDEERELRNEEGLFGECYDEDEEDDDDEVERSVLLFNTWADKGPLDVLPDTAATGSIPDGIEIEGTDLIAYLAQEQVMRLAEWEEDYGPNFEVLQCNPREEWVEFGVPEVDRNSDSTEVRVSLMGKQKRRLYPKQQVSLQGSGLRAALDQEQDVSHLELF
jgi:hypothetical protein